MTGSSDPSTTRARDRRGFLADSARLGAWLLAGSALPRFGNGQGQPPPGRELASMTIIELAQRLRSGQLSSRQLVEQALAAIANPQGEGARSFLRVHRAQALATAGRIDAQRRAGAPLSPLAGIPVSLKDLFDEAGVVTLGASKALAGAPPARRDATVVARLRGAGAVLIGRTTLTEFAYSCLGVNPHYGTPRNSFDRATGRIPGGSTSGGAISVSDGMAAAAIGTDTGGSVRIPAALNGLVGFKPTAPRIPQDGMLPLSRSLDSVGPIARSVEDCALLDQVLSGEAGPPPEPARLRELRFAAPLTLFQDDLSPEVAAAFRAALGRIAAAGATVVEEEMPVFAEAATANPRGLITSVEAYAWHRRLMAERGGQYDPRVIRRIQAGSAVSPAEYRMLLDGRARFIQAVEAAAAGYDALLMPTTPDPAPALAEVTRDDESYFRHNGRMCRNPSVVNLFDGCALSLPCHQPGRAPVGLMIAGTRNSDRRILAIGRAVEQVL